MPIDKISSYDSGYRIGDLSLFPSAIDSYETLYEARNESRTKLRAAVTYTADTLVVESTESFPEKGILRLFLPNRPGFDSEFVYYDKKTRDTFSTLKRGFCGTRQNSWPIETAVESGVFAEHHNALKDAVLQIENYVGISTDTSSNTLTGLLKQIENRFLAPIPVYRSYPLEGRPPLTVSFHNFSSRTNTRYFWDFGDGGTSYERNPTHTYTREGNFAVQLRVVSQTGGQGFTTKTNYIKVSNDYVTPFAYISPMTGKSIETATKTSTSPTKFTFTDQTQGLILSRLWQFDDGESILNENPNIQTAEHYYAKPGTYRPSLLITYEGTSVNRAIFSETIQVD